ncbi:hypothetical protein GCM10010384_24990 [Streptomyces djakartensis]|uniref:Uncharacterized protein n=1 Tax=Streptomyces djakartensis TaxID=68193 RepID=A0ABQ2ZKS6_9ACTN|nr:hypothetical protein GCM10010384_24990 [Streptomyces djakartensis]
MRVVVACAGRAKGRPRTRTRRGTNRAAAHANRQGENHAAAHANRQGEEPRRSFGQELVGQGLAAWLRATPE